MKSEKLDLNTITNTGDIAEVARMAENQLPKGAMLFDKGLLPSRGKMYEETIYVKKLSTLDIKNLSTINENNANYVLNTVITSCVLGIDTNKICVGDKMWFIYYLRSLTYNDLGYNIKHTCEHCGNAVNLEYHLKNLKVDYLDKEVPEYIELDNGDRVKIKFPTIGSELQATRLKNSEDIIENINSDLLDFSMNIAEVNGKKMTMMKAYEYVCSMDAMDFTKLVNAMTSFTFTIRPYAEFECPSCGEVVYEKAPFTPTFFLPKV